jgi:hypothetical protein
VRSTDIFSSDILMNIAGIIFEALFSFEIILHCMVWHFTDLENTLLCFYNSFLSICTNVSVLPQCMKNTSCLGMSRINNLYILNFYYFS